VILSSNHFLIASYSYFKVAALIAALAASGRAAFHVVCKVSISDVYEIPFPRQAADPVLGSI